MRYWNIAFSLLSMVGLVSCSLPETNHSSSSIPPEVSSIKKQDSLEQPIFSSHSKLTPEEGNKEKLNIQIGEYVFTATLDTNGATQKLMDLLQDHPLTLELEDYGGFEKVGSLGMSLPTQDQQILASPGDIVLYNGHNIVIFYDSNTWNYTKIGSIDDLTNLENALAPEKVTIQLSLVLN